MNSADADFREKFYGLLIIRDKQATELNATVREIAALYNERHELARETEGDFLDDKRLNSRLGRYLCSGYPITEPSCDLTKVKGTELTSDAATPILNKSETTPTRKDPR